jgi:prophage maintenance system killer protein
VARFSSLPKFFWLAEQVTGIDAEVLADSGSINLTDSARHAPQPSFGDYVFYPDLIDKAAVLTCHLEWNHPLADGKRELAGHAS